jgi:hypothetical protein
MKELVMDPKTPAPRPSHPGPREWEVSNSDFAPEHTQPASPFTPSRTGPLEGLDPDGTGWGTREGPDRWLKLKQWLQRVTHRAL